jgi:hypothetical protein
MQGSTLSASFGTEQSFRLNSLYDPDFTGTGHQPYAYDQITPFYTRYLVDEVDIKLTFSDPQGDGVYVACFIKNFNDPATLTGASISQANERPTVWIKPLNNTGGQVAVFQKRVKIHELMGITAQQYSGAWPATAASTGSNPSHVSYLSFAVADANASSPSLTCKCTIELKYHSTFWDRVMPAQS